MIVGIGIDVVEIERVARLIDRKQRRALLRLFTEAEIAYAEARALPAQHFAARVAAKEAAYKALSGTPRAREIGWNEIEVIPAEGSSPSLALHGRAQARAEELGVTRMWLSLTHARECAAATVILERD